MKWKPFIYEKLIEPLRPNSFCFMVLHCVTYGGGNDKIIFGKGTQLIVETSKFMIFSIMCHEFIIFDSCPL